MEELKHPEEVNKSVHASNEQRKETYATLRIEMMEVKVEKGYANSFCGTPD